ncbi:MAG TPA: HD domain-containing protein [Acidimicrobiales bacterium]|nr:HD domain-containing protein [Acidimicrobiales bacterium]
MSSTKCAARLARELLGENLPQRYEHVSGVAAKVEAILTSLQIADENLVSAAWLHDVGYASSAVDTGLHALDGARYARRRGFDDQVVRLIAHHSCAHLEAKLRGLETQLLEEFPLPGSPQRSILTAADMSVGPGGKPMSIDARLADIRQRYAPSDVVNRFLDEAETELRRIVAEVDGWLLNPSTALPVRP